SRQSELSRRCLFCHDTHFVIQHLHEPAAYVEAAFTGSADTKLAVTEQRHQRCVAGEDSHVSIVCGRNYRVRLALKENGLGRDYRYLEHRLRVGETLRSLDYTVDTALHEERLLRILIEFAGYQTLERRDGLLELHVLALEPGEL